MTRKAEITAAAALARQRVSLPMLAPVMKLPEVIEVEQQKSEVGAFSKGAVPFSFEGFVEAARSRQASPSIDELHHA